MPHHLYSTPAAPVSIPTLTLSGCQILVDSSNRSREMILSALKFQTFWDVRLCWLLSGYWWPSHHGLLDFKDEGSVSLCNFGNWPVNMVQHPAVLNLQSHCCKNLKSHIMSLFFFIFKCGVRFCPLIQCEVWIGQILYHTVLIDECKQYWDGRIHDKDWCWMTYIPELSWVCCASEIITLLACYVVLMCS